MTENVLKCRITLGCPYELLSLQCHNIIRATKKKERTEEKGDFKQLNLKGKEKIEVKAGRICTRTWVQSSTSGGEGRKYLAVTLCFLWTSGWRAANGFSCDNLSAFAVTLLPRPLFDRTLFFLVLKHSHDPLSSAMKSFCTFFFSSLFKLFHNFLPSLHYFIYESCRAVNLGKPASFTLTKQIKKALGYRLCVNALLFLSAFLFYCWVITKSTYFNSVAYKPFKSNQTLNLREKFFSWSFILKLFSHINVS